MSDDITAEDLPDDETPEGGDKPPKKKGFIGRLLPSSTPGRAGCLLWLFLLITVITVWTIFFRDPNNVPWRHSMTWMRIVGVVILVFFIPWVLYRALRIWMESDRSPYPEIDYAWEAGLAALESHGLSLTTSPIFLVMGSKSELHEKAILSASGIHLRVNGVPEGPAPLRWYANPDAIFIFCSDSCWLSSLAALREKKSAEARALRGNMDDGSMPAFQPPDDFGPAVVSAPPPSPANAARGTIMLDQYGDQPEGAEIALSEQQESSQIRGTLMLDAGVGDRDQGGAEYFAYEAEAHEQPAVLSAYQSSEQLRRLQYVCHLIKQGRSPICPINGVLTMMPFELIESGPVEVEQLKQAIKSDLSTIHYGLQIRCPVAALIVGMENERGFRELVRRVGRDRAASQRFGRKFDVRALASSEDLFALSAHVCGALEDWVYTLFREDGSLSRPGNLLLYGLLCKVRSNLKARLGDILAGGFSYDVAHIKPDDSILFTGCYFAATGETPDRQAFVKGVFDKLIDEQEQVEWTNEAINEYQRLERVAQLGLFAGLILFGLLVWMFFW